MFNIFLAIFSLSFSLYNIRTDHYFLAGMQLGLAIWCFIDYAIDKLKED